jgi:hypothetical protein
MSDEEIILYPADPHVDIDMMDLRDSLQSIGLIAETFDFFGKIHYRQGKQFLSLVEFVEERVAIILEPVDGKLQEVNRQPSKESCHVELEGPFAEVAVIASGNTRAPLCPSCGYKVQEWGDVLSKWYDNKLSYVWLCPECQKQVTVDKLNWHKTAGFARYSINIWDAFYDAKPTHRLLDKLEQFTNTDWDYLYYRL